MMEHIPYIKLRQKFTKEFLKEINKVLKAKGYLAFTNTQMIK